MDETTQRRRATGRRSTRGVVAAALAIGGLSASLLPATTAGAAPKGVVVSTMKTAKFGTVLVSGKTLYMLQPSKTACTAACLKVWPALALPKGVSKATAGSGVSASKLGSKSLANGVRQVTYNGKALYTFIGDKSAGQVNGNVSDTWGKWSDVATIKPASAPASSPTTSGGSTAGSGGAAF
jgi:predicted lipoprotein with Yx(FWY)xxD motif